MKKTIKIVIFTAILSISSATAAFGGSWKQDTSGWWWQETNKTYPISTWKWIDSDSDGFAECYYFDQNGYLLTDAAAPDGSQVNQSGAWIEDGIVRLRASDPFTAKTIDQEGLKLYQEADQKSASLAGLDISADIQMAMTYENITVPMTMNMVLKYHDLSKDNMEFLTKVTVSLLGQRVEQTAFYTNGIYYLDVGNEKRFKMKIGVEDMTDNLTLGGLTGQFGAFMENIQIANDSAGNKVLFYSTDEKGLEAYLQNIYDDLGTSLDGLDTKLQEIRGKAVFTPEGYFSREQISIYMTITEGEEAMGILTILDINYNNPGQPVSIQFPSTEGYQEVVY